ncbi:MAG: hypothetical protein ACI83P_001026 [Janthinobacterium sp.]|jgi:hypothetical protein
MAKTNFQYEKRQKELEKKKKTEEKAKRKLEAKNNPKPGDDVAEGDAAEGDAAVAAEDATDVVADTPETKP